MNRSCMDGMTRDLLRAAVAMLISLSASTLLGQGPGGGAPGPPGPANGPSFQQRVAQSGGPIYGPATQQIVADVRIRGHETMPEHEIFTHLRTRRDREFDPEVVQADVRRLAGTGRFADVDTYTENTAAGVIVTFQLKERPAIRYVRFHGNRAIGDERLTANSGLKMGDPINRFAVREARRKTEEYYRSKGFSLAQVEVMQGDKPGDRGVVFQIMEGPIERVGSVAFVGNTVVSSARLRTQIESKPGIMWYFGSVDREKIDADVEKLTAYYRNLGYFNARVGREMEFDDSGKWLKLRFVIDEGPRYRVRNVSIAGTERFSQEEVKEILTLASGEHFNLSKMQADVNALKDLYGGKGFIFAKIKADPRFLEEPGMLDLTYDIEEGNRFRVGEINVHIRGENPHTRESVVLNRLSLRPGDIVDIREVRASERRLRYSQLFRNNPAQGVAPRIVMRTPEIDELETLAKESGGRSYRGQSPRDRENAVPTANTPHPQQQPQQWRQQPQRPSNAYAPSRYTNPQPSRYSQPTRR